MNFPFDGLNIDPDDELDDANDSAAVERVLGHQLAEPRDDRPLLILLQCANQRLLQHGLPFQLLNRVTGVSVFRIYLPRLKKD